jgi:hypothetical protein
MINLEATSKTLLNDVHFKGEGYYRIWAGWRKRLIVYIGEKRLEGFIQVRRRFKREDVITCFNDRCVMGSNWEWLARQNGIEVKNENH